MSRFAPFILSLCICIAVFAPLGVFAQVPEFEGPIVPCGTEESGVTDLYTGNKLTCGACELLTLAQNIINFIIFLATVAAVLMFVYAGFLYITAAGDTGKIKRAHGIFTAVVIGFVIVLAAWLIIDTLMKAFINESKFGPWNEILCKPVVPITPITPTTPGGNTPVSVTNPSTPGKFSYDPGVAAQREDASSQLEQLLQCMEEKVPAGVGRISSISDNAIVTNTKTFAQCKAGQTGCAHTKYSCHYGGGVPSSDKCLNRSWAVDFGDQENKVALADAARSCRSDVGILDEGDHIHISIGKAENCNCDQTLTNSL